LSQAQQQLFSQWAKAESQHDPYMNI